MLNITKTAEGSALNIALEGRLDTTTSPQLEEEMKASLDGVTALVLGSRQSGVAWTVPKALAMAESVLLGSLLVMALFLIVCMCLSHIRLGVIVKGLQPLLFIMILTGLLNMFYTPGRELVHFWIFTITYEGWKNGENESVLTTVPVVFCRANASSPAGVYDIVIDTNGEAANYKIIPINGKLTVKQPDAIEEVGANGKTYDVYTTTGHPEKARRYIGIIRECIDRWWKG